MTFTSSHPPIDTSAFDDDILSEFFFMPSNKENKKAVEDEQVQQSVNVPSLLPMNNIPIDQVEQLIGQLEQLDGQNSNSQQTPVTSLPGCRKRKRAEPKPPKTSQKRKRKYIVDLTIPLGLQEKAMKSLNIKTPQFFPSPSYTPPSNTPLPSTPSQPLSHHSTHSSSTPSVTTPPFMTPTPDHTPAHTPVHYASPFNDHSPTTFPPTDQYICQQYPNQTLPLQYPSPPICQQPLLDQHPSQSFSQPPIDQFPLPHFPTSPTCQPYPVEHSPLPHFPVEHSPLPHFPLQPVSDQFPDDQYPSTHYSTPHMTSQHYSVDSFSPPQLPVDDFHNQQFSAQQLPVEQYQQFSTQPSQDFASPSYLSQPYPVDQYSNQQFLMTFSDPFPLPTDSQQFSPPGDYHETYQYPDQQFPCYNYTN